MKNYHDRSGGVLGHYRRLVSDAIQSNVSQLGYGQPIYVPIQRMDIGWTSPLMGELEALGYTCHLQDTKHEGPASLSIKIDSETRRTHLENT